MEATRLQSFLALILAVMTGSPALAQDDPDSAWDVEGDHGPSALIEFETTEGMWMNVDVSPTGRWIVFDLLGDIYRVSIGGGDAELLSGGISFEHQPRFSPARRHWELWMFVQGGMTPMEALRAATLWGAEYIGLGQDLGSIEPGKLADLVVLDANPLDDIKNSERIHMVMKNGFLYDDDLNELWPEEKPVAPLRWRQ